MEADVRLARVVPEQTLSFRTLARWAANGDELGLTSRCCKPHAGKDKRRMPPALQQYIKDLVMRNLN